MIYCLNKVNLLNSYKIIFDFSLGDGFLNKSGAYDIEQRERNYDYLVYQKQVLDLFHLPNKLSYRGTRKGIRLKTRSTVQGKYIRNQLYKKGKKQLTQELLDKYFDLHSLSMLYMDDGCYYSKTENSGELSIATHSFSEQENILLAEKIKLLTNVDMKLSKSGKHCYLRLFKQNLIQRFFDCIYMYIVPSFRYKLGEPYEI